MTNYNCEPKITYGLGDSTVTKEGLEMSDGWKSSILVEGYRIEGESHNSILFN